jgi:hypothetical protein
MSKIDLRLLLQNKLIANSNVPTTETPSNSNAPPPKPAPRRELKRMASTVRPHRALRPRRRS